MQTEIRVFHLFLVDFGAKPDDLSFCWILLQLSGRTPLMDGLDALL
jgi:hypothetical protein